MTSRILTVVTVLALSTVGGGDPAAAATLVQLRPAAVCTAAATLSSAGATLVVPELRLWRLRENAGPTVRRLRSANAVAYAGPERSYAPAAAADAADPLVPTEWWRTAVGVDTLTPPGPGVPISIVDSGVSFGHPEFAARPDLIALNVQEPAPIGGVHGTAVASVAAAAVNGVGVVGIYPTAVLRSYDVSLGDGTRLPASEIAAGIVGAARAGRSVINLSLGGNRADSAIEAAVGEAVRRGSLVVAASGNSALEGNWLSYPGAGRHVLTVGATDQNSVVAPFSTRSAWLDLAAPGVDIPIASALDNAYGVQSGTSLAAPMVAGAAAWIWTVRPELDASQVAEILRRSARDLGAPGFDQETGYGLLDVPTALATPTPQRDLVEPNDEIATAATLTSRARPAASTSGRVIAFEDPRDVLRVWLPARMRVTVTGSSDAGLRLTLQRTTLAASGQLAAGRASGTATTLSYRNPGAARQAYVVVTPARGVRGADYRVRISSP